MRHVLSILAALLSFTVHAGNSFECQKDLSGSKLLVGLPSKRLEAMAERLVLAEFNRTIGQNKGQAKDVDTLISLRLAQGSMMYVIGITRAQAEDETYAVRVSDRDSQVTRLETNEPQTDDENSPARKIERVAIAAALNKYPVGTTMPGTWDGEAPKVTHALVTISIPTGQDHGVVLVDVHGENSKGPVVLHAVAHVRFGAIYTLSEPEPMKHEQDWGKGETVATPTAVGTEGTRGIAETRALYAVLEKVLAIEPNARVSAVKVQSLNIEMTSFVVTVTRARGRLGDRGSVYDVSVEPKGVVIVTHIAEQG